VESNRRRDLWIAAGLVLVLAFPVVARRVGAALA
jgi:hypothetical protein